MERRVFESGRFSIPSFFRTQLDMNYYDLVYLRLHGRKIIASKRETEGCVYYWIADDRVDCDDELGYDHIYDSANYFSTREKAEEINFKQTLFRKLQRFSDENGGNEIDWNNDLKGKWFIVYGHDLSNNKKLYADNYVSRQFVGTVYFISREVAEQAIELFHDDLIKYFTGDFGGKG